MKFEDILDEQYKGFGQTAHVDTTELRILYYGRLGLFVSFTDDGEYSFEPENNELPRPNGIVCHAMNDVVGSRVKSKMFYANVFRANTSRFITDIRNYTRDDYERDVTKLAIHRNYDELEVNIAADSFRANSTLKIWFEKLWHLTEHIAKSKGGDTTKIWRQIFLDLGYDGVSDPSGTGILVLGRSPVTIYFDYRSRKDIDIVPIQKYRTDPRQRVVDKVERTVKSLGVQRNRISLRKVDRYRKGGIVKGFTDRVKELAASLGILL